METRSVYVVENKTGEKQNVFSIENIKKLGGIAHYSVVAYDV